MGYESKFYVVDKSKNVIPCDNGRKWGEVIAMFDMCKCYAVSEKIRKYPATDCYIYDGTEEQIVEDLYGDPLREIPLPDAINIIETAASSEEHYRRFAPILGLLKGFDLSEWGDLVVLHYGH